MKRGLAVIDVESTNDEIRTIIQLIDSGEFIDLGKTSELVKIAFLQFKLAVIMIHANHFYHKYGIREKDFSKCLEKPISKKKLRNLKNTAKELSVLLNTLSGNLGKDRYKMFSDIFNPCEIDSLFDLIEIEKEVDKLLGVEQRIDSVGECE